MHCRSLYFLVYDSSSRLLCWLLAPPAGIAHSPQVSTGMNVWGIMDIKSCVLGEWCLEKVGIAVGLVHGKCGMCTLVSGCLRGERQEMILLVELLNFVCHDEWCTEQTYA